MLDEVGQHRREIAGAFQRRPGCHPQRRPEFGGDDHCQRRLAQSGRAGQQDVIRCAAAVFGTLDDQLQLFTHSRLADELPQRAGPQARVNVTFADGQCGADLPVLDAIVLVEATHLVFPSSGSADRSAVDVVAPSSEANTLSVASSACLAAKPSPTRASTTGLRTLWPLTGALTDGETGPILSRSSSTIRSAPR